MEKRKRRMRFGTWCKKDLSDERKINYTLTRADGSVQQFTSEDTMPYHMMEVLRYSWIDSIELSGNEWYAVLYEE